MKTCDICKKQAPGCVPYEVCENCSHLAWATQDLLEACNAAHNLLQSDFAISNTGEGRKALSIMNQLRTVIAKAEGIE